MEHSIVDIFSETGEKILFDSVKIIEHNHKYSNVNRSVYRIIIDDRMVKKKDKITATYRCPICERLSGPFRIQNITRRLREGKTNCRVCKEENLDKKQNQSKFMTENFSNIHKKKYEKKKIKKLTAKEKIAKSNLQFIEELIEFQNNYFNMHFTNDEFIEIQSHIVSVNSIPIDKLEYIEHVKIHNKEKYFPRFYHIEKEVLYKPIKITYKCKICKAEHTAKQLSGTRSGKCRFLCFYCYMATDKFKIRTVKNCNGDLITYQSGLEFYLIKFCNDNKIVIEDGPVVRYKWNKKARRYKTDFILPNKEMIVEIKGHHIWHKRQIENGKWDAKVKAVNEYCDENDLKFHLVFVEDMDNLKSILVRYSPTSSES